MKKNYTLMFLLFFAASIMGGFALKNSFYYSMVVGYGLGIIFLICSIIFAVKNNLKGQRNEWITSQINCDFNNYVTLLKWVRYNIGLIFNFDSVKLWTVKCDFNDSRWGNTCKVKFRIVWESIFFVENL